MHTKVKVTTDTHSEYLSSVCVSELDAAHRLLTISLRKLQLLLLLKQDITVGRTLQSEGRYSQKDVTVRRMLQPEGRYSPKDVTIGRTLSDMTHSKAKDRQQTR